MKNKRNLNDVSLLPPAKLEELNAACDRILQRRANKILSDIKTDVINNPMLWQQELVATHHQENLRKTYSKVGKNFIMEPEAYQLNYINSLKNYN